MIFCRRAVSPSNLAEVAMPVESVAYLRNAIDRWENEGGSPLRTEQSRLRVSHEGAGSSLAAILSQSQSKTSLSPRCSSEKPDATT